MESFASDKRVLEYDSAKSYPDIFCFSTTRHGGYGKGNYASFNCTHYCGDEPADVLRNRQLLHSLLPRHEQLIIPRQTHSTNVRLIDRSFIAMSREEQDAALEGVDALVTSLPRHCICVSTADCIPVLCYDRRQKVAAAIHAGWRGTAGRIVGKTLQAMNTAYGCKGEDIVAFIGPGISVDAFEVGDEVYEAFRTEGFDMQKIALRKKKWHIDLWEANRLQLMAGGVSTKRIELAGICTYRNHEDFFSARRLGINSGRILSGIMML